MDAERGFTLTELVVAIVIAGILAVVALPRWQGDTGFEARQFRDETVAVLRLAQKSAIAAHRRACANFSSSQVGISLSANFDDANCGGGFTLNNPAGGLAVASANGGATYSPIPPTLSFDAGGRPAVSATITINGLPGMPIVVEAETGYVH